MDLKVPEQLAAYANEVTQRKKEAQSKLVQTLEGILGTSECSTKIRESTKLSELRVNDLKSGEVVWEILSPKAVALLAQHVNKSYRRIMRNDRQAFEIARQGLEHDLNSACTEVKHALSAELKAVATAKYEEARLKEVLELSRDIFTFVAQRQAALDVGENEIEDKENHPSVSSTNHKRGKGAEGALANAERELIASFGSESYLIWRSVRQVARGSSLGFQAPLVSRAESEGLELQAASCRRGGSAFKGGSGRPASRVATGEAMDVSVGRKDRDTGARRSAARVHRPGDGDSWEENERTASRRNFELVDDAVDDVTASGAADATVGGGATDEIDPRRSASRATDLRTIETYPCTPRRQDEEILEHFAPFDYLSPRSASSGFDDESADKVACKSDARVGNELRAEPSTRRACIKAPKGTKFDGGTRHGDAGGDDDSADEAGNRFGGPMQDENVGRNTKMYGIRDREQLHTRRTVNLQNDRKNVSNTSGAYGAYGKQRISMAKNLHLQQLIQEDEVLGDLDLDLDCPSQRKHPRHHRGQAYGRSEGVGLSAGEGWANQQPARDEQQHRQDLAAGDKSNGGSLSHGGPDGGRDDLRARFEVESRSARASDLTEPVVAESREMPTRSLVPAMMRLKRMSLTSRARNSVLALCQASFSGDEC